MRKSSAPPNAPRRPLVGQPALARIGRAAASARALLAALVVLLLVALAQHSLAGWGVGDAVSPLASTAAQPPGAVAAMFTTPALVYPDRPARRVPPPFERMLLADIDAARQSIDVALFEYDLASLSAALARAQQRGVAVRLALDRESLEHPDNARWAGDLQRVGVPVFWQESTAFLHSKFLIIDNAVVWAGSWNATSNGIYRNNNNLLRFSAPPLVANYAAEFAQMAQGSFGTRKQARTPYPVVLLDNMRVETYFSPQDAIEPRLLERVAAARHSIRFLAFSFTSDALADAMLARQVAGVQVQGVMERRSASGIGAEFARLRAGGADVWEDGNCYTMHHKVIIIDDATVITGSYNFTRRAEHTNDENLLIIDSPALAAQFAAEFERVYRQARNPPRCE